MAERVRRGQLWASWNRFERIALASTVLIWIGVALFGFGLYIGLKNVEAQRSSYAQATALALVATQTATAFPEALNFPPGWATATPTATSTPVRPTPTWTPVASSPVFTVPQSPTQAELQFEPDLSFLVITPTLTIRVVVTPSGQPTPESMAGRPAAAGPPDRLVIRSIRLDSKITPVGWHVVEEGEQRYSVWDVADYAVGWHKTSAFPGNSSNLVLSGHNNIRGEVFRYLIDVQVGDQVFVYVGERAYYYKVTEKHILKEKGEPPEVRRENARWIAPTADERLTMVTCWPYTGNSHRLVVVAMPVEPPDSKELEE